MIINGIAKKILCLALVFQLICGTCVMGVFAENEESVNEDAISSDFVTDDFVTDDSVPDEESIDDDAVLMDVDSSWVKVSDNKPVFASAYVAGKEAYLATDGDTSTAFVSAKQNLGTGVESAYGKMNERFVIDLMQETAISGIKIQAAAGCGTDVLIYAGNDNEFNTKEKIYEGNVSDAEMSVIEAPVNIRENKYRYVIVEKNDYTKFGITEIEVYSTEADTTAANNVRRVSFGKTAYANNRGGYAGLNLKSNPINISSETYLGDAAAANEVSHFYFVDLGAEYEVPYITMSAGIWRYGISDLAATLWRKARSDFDIIGTNDPNFATSSDNDVVLYHYNGEFGANSAYGADANEPGADSGMAVFENTEHKTEKFRYIGIRRSKSGPTTERIVLSTFNVYAGGIMVEGFNTTQTDADKLEIRANITGLNTDGLTALVTAFDVDGNCIGTKAEKIEFNGSEKYAFSWTPEFNGGEVYDAKFMLVDSINNFNVRWYNLDILSSGAEISTPTHTVDEETENKNYAVKQENENVFIYGNAKYDLLTAMIIKPTEEESLVNYDNLDEANYDSSVVYMSSVKTVIDKPYEFKAVLGDSAPIGTYLVKLFYPDGTSEDVYEFYYFSQAENNIVTGLLKEADASEVLGIISDEKYATAFKDCNAEIEKCGDEFGKYFVLAREIMVSGEFSGSAVQFTDYTQFKDVVNFASMLNALVKRDDYKEYITKYKNLYMPKVFDNNYNEAKFEKIYPIVRNNVEAIETADDINSCIKKTIALGLVYNGSQNDVKTAITDYAGYLDVNAATISSSGYSAFEIAKYIPKTLDDIALYASSGMEAAVKNAIKKVKSENSKNTTTSVGGGTSGMGNKIYPESAVVPPVAEKEPTVSFDDIYGFDWAKDAIINLAEKKIIQGDGKGSFKPNDYITREEVVKLVVEMFEITTEKSDDLFTDCTVTDWYYPYIMAAKYNNIVKGLSVDSFGVGQAVTRQDLAVILRRAMTFAKYDFNGKNSVKLTDEDRIDMYAVDGVLTLCSEGIINGFEDGSFRPHDNTTRAEAAVMINRVYENYQRQQIALKAAIEEE